MRAKAPILALILANFALYPGVFSASGAESLIDLSARSTLAASQPFSGPGRNLTGDPKSLRELLSLGDNPSWRGRIDPIYGRSFIAPSIAVNKCDGSQQCTSTVGTYPYEEYMIDPTGYSNQPVLKLGYPKGSWSPNSPKPGGTLFYVYPYKTDPTSPANPISTDGASLQYEVYFPPDFDFVKGGKLLGISGGDRSGRGCGGGVDPINCFSCRIMWRREGNGEAYIYAPEGHQRADFCTVFPDCSSTGPYPCTECNFSKGVSFGRGSFKFKVGEWQTIRLTVGMNTPGQTNGYVTVEVNGQTVISYDGMQWRTRNGINVEAVEIASWFGGSDETWGPPSDTYVLIRNLKMYRSGAATGQMMAATLDTAGMQATTQTVIEEVIQV